MRRLLILGLSALFSTPGLATSPIQRAVIPSVVDIPNPCTGEPVRVTSETHLTERLVLDANGGSHGQFRVQEKNVSAIGLLSGASYTAVLRQSETGSDWVNRNQESVFILNVLLISSGQTDNFMLKQSLRFRIEDDGTMTRLHDHQITACR
jgi:hypothetical protein